MAGPTRGVHAARTWAAWGATKVLTRAESNQSSKKTSTSSRHHHRHNHKKTNKEKSAFLRGTASAASHSTTTTTTTTTTTRGPLTDRTKWDLWDPLEPITPERSELHPVLDLIRERHNRGRKDDGFKLGLVVEGGGMRGITSAGMLVELEKKGLQGVFDAVYGSSAGAINLTFFLSRDKTGADIYTNHIANKDFISLSRLIRRKTSKRKPVLDISFLLDHVMETVLPLDWDKVVKSPTPLKVVASHLDGEGGSRPVLLENFRDKHDLKECLRASACVPGIAGGPIKHRGLNLVDAMVHEPIPIWSAVDDGCTHVLTLSTKPRHEGMRRSVAMKRNFIRDWFMSPGYLDRNIYKEVERTARGSYSTEELLGRESEVEVREGFGAEVYTLFPDEQPVGSLCRKVNKLWEARQQGHDKIEELFKELFAEYPSPSLFPVD